MRLRFTPRATKDIANIADYLRQHSPAAATRVRASIYRGLQNLLIFPLLGREQRQTGARKLVTPRYGYLIYYLVDQVAGEIVIVSVKHPAQAREEKDA